MGAIKKLNLFANQSATSPAVSTSSKETKQISPLSSNGFNYTYNAHEKDSSSERADLIGEKYLIHPEEKSKEIFPLSSPSSEQNSDNYNRIVDAVEAYMYEEIEGGLKISSTIGALREKISEALNNNQLIRVKKGSDEKIEFEGDEGFGEILKKNEQAGKSVYVDGSVIEIGNFTFKKLTDSDQKLLRNSVIIYLIYLKSIEKSENKKSSDHEITESSQAPHLEHANVEKSTPKRHKVDNLSHSEQNQAVAKTELQMQRLLIKIENLKKDKDLKKELKKLEEKLFLNNLIIKEIIVENQITSEFIKKCLIITSALQRSLDLLVLAHSPSTILRVSNRYNER